MLSAKNVEKSSHFDAEKVIRQAAFIEVKPGSTTL